MTFLAFDHIGITVADLDLVTSFFTGLGFEEEGRTFLEGAFVDAVTGIPDARTEIVSLRPHGGGTGIELARFIRPAHEPGQPDAMATVLGIRAVVLAVEDLLGTVERLSASGYALIGDVADHEGTWRMASVRGPEGLVISFAEKLT
jgi:catechol 2,3-dioxygenase-like lactoylglutathione lyase family enzyme